MAMGILTVMSILIVVTDSLPGKWEYIKAGPTRVVLASVGWSPEGRRKLIFVVNACENVLLTFYGRSSYVKVALGFKGNAVVYIVPSSACNVSGQCDVQTEHYVQVSVLSCNKWRYFWIAWSIEDGAMAIGTGIDVSKGLVHTLSGTALLEEALYATLSINAQKGGSMYLLKDTPPVFISPATDGSTEVTLAETDVNNTVLYTVEVNDQENDTVIAVILDDPETFQFDGFNLTNKKALDYEYRCIYQVKITINDKEHQVNTTLTIRLTNVFDEAPSVTATTMSIPEEMAVGTVIEGGYAVTDADVGDTLSYTLSGIGAEYFNINVSTGFLSLIKRIDFDPPTYVSSINMTLTVTDSAGLSDAVTLNFTIIDINDNVDRASSLACSAQENVFETWAIRILAIVLAVGLLGSVIYVIKPNPASRLKPRPLHQHKVQPFQPSSTDTPTNDRKCKPPKHCKPLHTRATEGSLRESRLMKLQDL